jgi:hypothetical protein
VSTRHERERAKAAAAAAAESRCAVCDQAIVGIPYHSQKLMMGGSDMRDIDETLNTCSLECAVFLSVDIHMHFIDARELDEHIMGDIPGATHDLILACLVEIARQEKAAEWSGNGPAPFVSDAVLKAEAVESWKRSQRPGQS